MGALQLSVTTTRLTFAAPFRIAGRVFEQHRIVIDQQPSLRTSEVVIQVAKV